MKSAWPPLDRALPALGELGKPVRGGHGFRVFACCWSGPRAGATLGRHREPKRSALHYATPRLFSLHPTTQSIFAEVYASMAVSDGFLDIPDVLINLANCHLAKQDYQVRRTKPRRSLV